MRILALFILICILKTCHCSNRIAIYTVVSDISKATYLIKTARTYSWEINIIHVEKNTKWKNILKVERFYDKLKKSSYDFVVLLDGYDIIVQSSPSDVLEYIYKIGTQKIILGDESRFKTPEVLMSFFRYPQPKTTKKSTIDYRLGKALDNPLLKHNTGIILGNRTHIITYLKALIEQNLKEPDISSDQYLLGSLAERNHTIIKHIELVDDGRLWHVGFNPTVFEITKKENRLYLTDGTQVLFAHRTGHKRYFFDWQELKRIATIGTVKHDTLTVIHKKLERLYHHPIEINITYRDAFDVCLLFIFFYLFFSRVEILKCWCAHRTQFDRRFFHLLFGQSPHNQHFEDRPV